MWTCSVTSSTADQQLAGIGVQLADAVVAAVPGWVVGAVVTVLDAWEAAGHSVTDRHAVLAEAAEAGQAAGTRVAAELCALVRTDVDAQRSTPLTAVRDIVSLPTGVLRRAGVAPVARDPVAERWHPGDDYGLAPASLAAVSPDLADLALAWGAAKAIAHRQRHED